MGLLFFIISESIPLSVKRAEFSLGQSSGVLGARMAATMCRVLKNKTNHTVFYKVVRRFEAMGINGFLGTPTPFFGALPHVHFVICVAEL